MTGTRMNTRIITITALVFALAAGRLQAAQCSDADIEALGWLDKMSRSLHEVSYHGTLTLQRGDEEQVMHVSHRVADGVSEQNLARLHGQKIRVTRSGHPQDCVHPGHELLRIGDTISSDNCGIANYYSFQLGDGERIADRDTVQLAISPRDGYRYGYRVYLDRENGLLLKSETLDKQASVLETVQFSSLSYSSDMPGVTDTPRVLQARHPAAETKPRKPVQREWTLRFIPAGFMPTESASARSGRRSYTDGLAVFSIFLEHLDRPVDLPPGVYRKGVTTGYHTNLVIEQQPVRVTAVGEVPVETLRQVAVSIQWVD